MIVMSGGEVFMRGSCRDVFSKIQGLSEIGLDIPQITQLMLLLRERGVEVPNDIYTVDAAVEAIRKLFTKTSRKEKNV